MAISIPCPVCKTVIPCQETSSQLDAECQQCHSHLNFVLFTNYKASAPSGPTAARLTEENEASCYNHSGKQAVCGCDSCGKLLCAVCEMEVENKHFCPDCVMSQGVREAFPSLEVERLCEEKSVWFTGMLGLTPYCCCILTIPLTIVLTSIFWSRPGSIVGGARSWMIGGILIGLSVPVLLGLLYSLLLLLGAGHQT